MPRLTKGKRSIRLPILAEAGIHVRELVQRAGDDDHQKIVNARGKAPLALDGGLELLPCLDKGGGIGFGHEGDVGGRLVAGGHPLGDDAPQSGNRCTFDGGESRGRPGIRHALPPGHAALPLPRRPS